MARYQVILAYDGTDFRGYQRQGKGRTVQSELEAALRGLNWQGRSILSAGRTDTGVHASGQVAAFDLEWEHSDETLVRALNAKLPADMAVRSARQTRADFHPRFDALGRSYQYRLFCQPERDPLRSRFAWRVWPAPDLALLRPAGQQLVGSRDFAALGSPMTPGGSTIREIFSTDWQPQGDGFVFTVSANAFLYRMVRRMVFLQLLVGQGRLTLEAFTEGLERQRSLPPGLAQPAGLTLVEVRYAE